MNDAPERTSLSLAATTLRPATPGDYAAFARLVPELGVDDETPDAARFANEIAPTARVAEREGEVVGVAFFQLIAPVVHVRMLIVAPGARCSGVGRSLMEAVAERGREAGCTEWCLNVKPENVPARRLYEALGLRVAYASKALRLDWSILDAQASAASGSRAVVVVAPEDDARIEHGAGLLAGMLARGRAEGRVLLAALRDDEVRGAAMFDQSFPGAFPFRAATLADAFTLLGAMRAHARHEHTFVNVVVEDQPGIADGLLDLGASLRLDILHMKGKIVG